MAIPFFEEDEPLVAAVANLETSQITDGDQVDGAVHSTDFGYDQVDYEALSAATSESQGTATSSQTSPSTEEQLLVWKMLALAMCKVIKQFYLQQKQQQQQQQTGKTTKLTATVQIQPQAQ